MTIGKPGVAGSGNEAFDRPTGVAVLPDGTIFVTDGHGKNDRIVKFAKDGTFVKAFGHHGSGRRVRPTARHQLRFCGTALRGRSQQQPRQILDQDGKFIASWKQFGHPSGIYIKNDILYVSDSHSNAKLGNANGRGIYIGSVKDGKVTAFIPDPDGDQADVNRIRSVGHRRGRSGETCMPPTSAAITSAMHEEVSIDGERPGRPASLAPRSDRGPRFLSGPVPVISS